MPATSAAHPSTMSICGANMPDQREANLARIRDNQRRSRARRKEYLQELESKYRQCEQLGVEASAEIQAAAKKVVEENRRLRALLKQQGFSESDIDGMAGEDTHAANALESLIGQRKKCVPASANGSRCQSATPSHRLPITPAPPGLQPRPTQFSASSEAGVRTPQYSGSHSALPSNITTTTASHTSSSHATYSLTSGPSQFHLPAMDYGLPYDDPYAWSTIYQPPSQPANSGNTSCHAAADAIRVIKPDVGNELEDEMGCSTDGSDCQVSNGQIFNIMDRYSSGGRS